MDPSTLPGRFLAVKWDTACPHCGKALTKGDSAWYIHKNDSKSKKSELFCDKDHAAKHYAGALSLGALAIVPEPPKPAKVVAATPKAKVTSVTIDGVEISLLGKHRQFELTLRCAHAGVNVLLVGPAGSGKSTLAKQVHEALVEIRGGEGAGWCSISLAADTPSSKLFGYKDGNGTFQPTPFYGTYTGDGADAGTALIDELDNGSATIVAGLNQALANGEAAFANGNADKHPHARVLATANTYGKGGDRQYVSRQQLDAASLDRFTTIDVEYDEVLETALAHAAGEGAPKADVDDLLSRVRYARQRAADKKLPLVFGPRSSIDGARLLAAGVPLETVLDIRVFAGVSSDVRAGLQ